MRFKGCLNVLCRWLRSFYSLQVQTNRTCSDARVGTWVNFRADISKRSFEIDVARMEWEEGERWVISSFALMGFFVDTIPASGSRSYSVKESRFSNIKFASYVPSRWKQELTTFVSLLNTVPSTQSRIELRRRRIFEKCSVVLHLSQRGNTKRLCSKFVDIPLVKTRLLSRSPFRRRFTRRLSETKSDPQKRKRRAKSRRRNPTCKKTPDSITTIITDKTKQRGYQRNAEERAL